VVENHIEKFVSKYGFVRKKISKSNPHDLLDLNLIPLFGTIQSLILFGQVISSKIFQKEKYNIVVTWPGMECLFPHAHEVWTLNPSYPVQQFYDKAYGIDNNSNNLLVIMRSLNENFLNVMNLSHIKVFYDDVLKDASIKIKEHEVAGMPVLPHTNLPLLRSGIKKSVLIYPSNKFVAYENKKLVSKNYFDDFYIDLVKNLIDRGYLVYCVQNSATIDLKSNFKNDYLIYIEDYDLYKIISYAYHAGCFLDFFGDLFHIGLLAQVPVFCMCERNLWYGMRRDAEHFLLDFTGKNENIFSFLYLFGGQKNLNGYFINSIIDRFDSFYYMNVANRQKTFVHFKKVDFGKYLSQKVFKYKPKFISKLYKEKEREKNEKV
jgi:hypothetical protein